MDVSYMTQTTELRPEFLALKAQVYRAWTGYAWEWVVTVPDARWACGYQTFAAPPPSVVGQSFTEAMRVLAREVRLRWHAGHPWRAPERPMSSG